jgi:hypothetical protein
LAKEKDGKKALQYSADRTRPGRLAGPFFRDKDSSDTNATAFGRDFGC